MSDIPSFDIKKYPGTYNPEDTNVTDLRHIQSIYAVLQWAAPKKVAEFGCWDGATTSALLESILSGAVKRVDLVDLKFRPNLLELVYKWFFVTKYEGPTHQYHEQHDAVIIDADHGIGAVADIATAIYRRIPLIICHDVGEHAACDWGPSAAVGLFPAGGYSYAIDQEKREGERTERGLLIAWLPELNDALIENVRGMLNRNDKWWETK